MSKGKKPQKIDAQIKYLADLAAVRIRDVALKKFRSGGIDPNAYNPEEYRLAKILVSAALEDPDVREQFYPLFDKDAEEAIKNLRHF